MNSYKTSKQTCPALVWKHRCNDRNKGNAQLIPKLERYELEDFYYKLLEQNNELKTDNNNLREQMKLLKTKLTRLSTHAPQLSAKSNCGYRSEEIMKSQQEEIQDLKQCNEQLLEKMRMLNLHLCSKKQYGSLMSLKLVRSESQLNKKKMKRLGRESDSESQVRFVSAPATAKQHNSPEKLVPESLKEAGSDVEVLKMNGKVDEVDNVETDNVAENLGENLENQPLVIELKEQVIALENEQHRIKEECAHTLQEYELKVSDLDGLLRVMKEEKERAVIVARQTFLSSLEKCESENRTLNFDLMKANLDIDELKCELLKEKGKLEEMEIKLHAAEMHREASSAVKSHLAKNNAILETMQDLVGRLQSKEKLHVCPNEAELRLGDSVQKSDIESLRLMITNVFDQMHELQNMVKEINARELSPLKIKGIDGNPSSEENQQSPQAKSESCDNKCYEIIPTKYKQNGNAAGPTDHINRGSDEISVKSNSPKSHSVKKSSLNIHEKNSPSREITTAIKSRAGSASGSDEALSDGKFKKAESPVHANNNDKVDDSATEKDAPSLPLQELSERDRAISYEEYSECYSSCSCLSTKDECEMMTLSEGEIPRCHFKHGDSSDNDCYRLKYDLDLTKLPDLKGIPPRIGRTIKAITDEVLKCKQQLI